MEHIAHETEVLFPVCCLSLDMSLINVNFPGETQIYGLGRAAILLTCVRPDDQCSLSAIIFLALLSLIGLGWVIKSGPTSLSGEMSPVATTVSIAWKLTD